MKKTIFYFPLDQKENADKEEADYWFGDQPHKAFLEMEDYLYEPSSHITREIIVGKYIKGLTITKVQDRFSEEGIIRRIALYRSI